jgi:hypothetical protein
MPMVQPPLTTWLRPVMEPPPLTAIWTPGWDFM